jgi:hypothetical protein
MLKVNSLLLTSQLLIALHSPNALFETGLRMCPAEKNRDSDPILSRAVRSLKSGLSVNNREIRACFAYFRVRYGGLSLHYRLRGGEVGIRTLGTGCVAKPRRVRKLQIRKALQRISHPKPTP